MTKASSTPGKRIGMTGDEAVANAVAVINPDVVAAYPITPQTIIVEHFSDFVNNGEVDTEYVCVESEHSAMSACVGASATGARVFTASASQGVALMFEILFIAAASRLPIVMAVANRALSGPINIHGELTDQTVCRDTGWISMFSESAQEAYDTSFLSFKIGEHPDVSLPVMYGLDGFILTHALEGVYPLDRKFVKDFLPERVMKYPTIPGNAVSSGLLALQDYYMEVKYQQEIAMTAARKVIPKVFEEFGEKTGRHYKMIEEYKMEDADIAFVTMGALAGTGKFYVDKLREEGKKVGLLKVKTFRPFPGEELAKALKGVDTVGVIDRDLTFGAPGPALYTDLKSSLYEYKDRPQVFGYIAGLGGRDVAVDEYQYIYEQVLKNKGAEKSVPVEWIGLRK
ncbi:MAG TPA: pyruvate ferredoxin oxidoreductase [candidate division Zixibacteria bacterium]|nr:pyruvate ferredoxin oxidoreductase [candidate division Zixibacteria bacterium]